MLMRACFNYLPADILQFVYVDQLDLFIISIRTADRELHTLNYQAEETNSFYVWLKTNYVKEGSIEECTYCGLHEPDSDAERLYSAAYPVLTLN